MTETEQMLEVITAAGWTQDASGHYGHKLFPGIGHSLWCAYAYERYVDYRIKRRFGDDQSVVMKMPADAMGNSIDEAVVRNIVGLALFKSGPIVAINHIWGAFNEVKEDHDYYSACKLAGLAMRFALENKPQ